MGFHLLDYNIHMKKQIKVTEVKICEDCRAMPSVINYSDEPIFSLTHGWGIIYLCRACFIKRMEKHLEQTKKGIEEQKRLLAKEEGRSK